MPPARRIDRGGGDGQRPHRKQPGAKHWWHTKVDPFADAWPLVDGWLMAEPAASAKVLMARLATMSPDAHAGNAQLRTLQRRVKAWRAERARKLIMGKRRDPIDVADKVPAEA